ncbi:MAG: hypothetical protein NE328_11185, partial [Lentisphaeraceae bacterium]|nr:hypothetical protein [Lentisphaeraceae bacterium]
EKVHSDKMTAVFVSEKNNRYHLKSLNPDSLEGAKKSMKSMKGYVLHEESGTKIDAINGIIDDRFHGIKIMKPYDELKHWWKKSTRKEKDDFMKWIKDQ